MNKREQEEVNGAFLAVYAGLLYDFRTFRTEERGESGGELSHTEKSVNPTSQSSAGEHAKSGDRKAENGGAGEAENASQTGKMQERCEFQMSHPMLKELKARYPIEEIAGKGGEFKRANRLNRWLASNLSHSSGFTFSEDGASVSWDALSLLDLAFGKADHGLNCAAKSLVLAGCCLAVGICARRVSCFPASPYDGDNHVVVEIYDRRLRKWVMLDPSTGGYVTDGTAPLSVLEMRNGYADMADISVVLPRQRGNVKELARRNRELNAYYAKNLFYLSVGCGSSPVGGEESMYLVPEGFDVCARIRRSDRYLLEYAEELKDERMVALAEKFIKEDETFVPRLGTAGLWDPPAHLTR